MPELLGRLGYLTQRVTRNLLPGPLAALGRRLFGGIPGGESNTPELFAEHYSKTLARHGHAIAGRRVLVFGHGPSYGFACALAALGARHVHLFDPYARPDDRLNARWLERYPGYLARRGTQVRPRPEAITELDADADPAAASLPRVDVVISTSVYEHLDDPDPWTAVVARATEPDGVGVHLIDLRDHFFHRPFEMLCYAEPVWRRWLDPRQHLNRWRVADYETVFERHFAGVAIEPQTWEREAFAAARPRIRPEFLSGDPEVDSIAEIMVIATRPRVAEGG